MGPRLLPPPPSGFPLHHQGGWCPAGDRGSLCSRAQEGALSGQDPLVANVLAQEPAGLSSSTGPPTRSRATLIRHRKALLIFPDSYKSFLSDILSYPGAHSWDHLLYPNCFLIQNLCNTPGALGVQGQYSPNLPETTSVSFLINYRQPFLTYLASRMPWATPDCFFRTFM